ncbi:MAG TPA: circadian clock protein KaiC [Candidatus Sulfotelmatobacter sp.]|nr:circadian clock protein KaiC [Candidatus Sulfotelmatobacter sp.]
MQSNETKDKDEVLEKSPTGIQGFDEITFGGLPKGRPSIIIGGPGSGKTLFSMEFLVNGATKFGEPGVFIAFEETEKDLEKNTASLGFGVKKLVEQNKLLIDHVRIEKSEIEETGEYDLEGLFIRLGSAIDEVGAKRIVLDTIESLFSGLSNQAIIRAELRRLFGWLKDRGMTALITAERGTDTMTRYGLEEYVSDCVIMLDHRVNGQISTRRLRVVKYRGSMHGTNEYPFIIDNKGFQLMPITSAALEYTAPKERYSTGIPELDEMLSGKGFLRGSTIMVSGSPGTGKTSIACAFANQVCKSNYRCMYFAMEESPNQIMRNMESIGINLEPCVKNGYLRVRATRPTLYGLETHLSIMQRAIDEFNPRVVIIDPISNLISVGIEGDVKAMLTRMIDYLKTKQITTLFTSLKPMETSGESAAQISSWIDTWISLTNKEVDEEIITRLRIIKSRGMAHSRKLRDFRLSEKGITIK